MASTGSALPRNAAASTTAPTANAWPIAMGTSDLATALAFSLLHPQRHREEPPHSGVDSVVSAEEQHQPQRVEPDLHLHHGASE